MAAWSISFGVAPVPKAADRLRSSTRLLLPSQCNCMPCFFAWFQIAGKSDTPMSSSLGQLLERHAEDRLGRIEGIHPPGPHSACRWMKRRRPSRPATPSRIR
jgi:hypothetical protein